MLQFLASFLPVMAIIVAVFVMAYKVKNSRLCVNQIILDFGWCIERSPAQVAFFMFSISAAIAASLIICAFSEVSKQMILNLDIIFFFSSLLIILLHRLKEYSSASL